MEFGKVFDAEINKIDFSLPMDGAQTLITLKEEQKFKNPRFYVGCAKWGRKEWLGLIYPSKIKGANFLDEYVKQFNSIELNATFYSMPKPEQIRKWKVKAEENALNNFIFCPKFPQNISHIKRLKNAALATDDYISAIIEFGEFLGPCFLQLSDNFGPMNRQILEDYLKSLPLDFKVFVELRHKDWFANPVVRMEVFEMFARLKKGVVITDASGRRDCLHMELTIPEAFIRFVGNGELHIKADFDRVDEWVQRIKLWLDRGLEKIYFFLHQHDEKDTPILANYTIQQFNKHLGSNLAEIIFINKPPGLYN